MRDLWRPGGGSSGLTHRRLEALLDHLPPESATKTAARDALSEDELAELARQAADQPGHGPWSHLELLVARLTDQVEWLIYATLARSGAKADKPKPTPRPGVRSASAKYTDDYCDRLRRLRGNGGA